MRESAARLSRLVLATALLGATLTLSLGCVRAAAQGARDQQDFTLIERGHYLTVLGDCAACHTDPNGGGAFAGGRAIQTPFGNVLAANITPDRDTGIGEWSDDQFDAALREGRRPDGSRLYPAMPYIYYSRMSREDTRAIHAYLNTLPAVHALVASDQLPFPFSVRAGMHLWDALFFKPGEFVADASKSAPWNRGALLVQGPGHCGACHTPKNVLGADHANRALTGYSIQGWFAPDLTNDAARGLANWSNEDIVEYLRLGHNRFAAASGPMAEEVADSSSQMSTSDLRAIATYLKGDSTENQPPPSHALASSDPMMRAGAAIYEDVCAACHKLDGTGVPYLFPDIAQSASVASREPTSVLHVLLRGARSVATDSEPTAPAMPGFGGQLTDLQIAAVATYVRNSWGHSAAAVSEGEVRKARAGLADAAD